MGNCWSTFRIMGNCLPIFGASESTNPHHHVSTPSSPPSMEPSLPTSGDAVRPSFPLDPSVPISEDPVRPSPPVDPSLPTSGDTVHPSPSMEPSLPTSGDAVHPSPPVDPSVSISEDSMHPSPSMEPSLPSSADPGHSSPSIDAIESIRRIYEKIDPVELIHTLVSFIENQLYKEPSEAESSSSEGCLATVREVIQHAYTTIDTISNEAGKVSESDAVKEMRRITLKVLEGMGEMHQVFIGLSLAVFAAERHTSVSPRMNECKELLLKILQLAQHVKLYGEQMLKTQANDLQISDEKGMLCNAVVTIVEGAVIACNYLDGERGFRFWCATTATAQLKKTNRQLRDITNSLLSSLERHLDKDVFLSHSGKQKNFVRQLYVDLNREYVSCFFDEDDNSLPRGQKFPPLIFKAAETCKIAVVVLSQDFIRSKWPMLELSAFIKARAKKTGKNAKLELIPIFFNISLRELSHITKDFPRWKELEESDDTRGQWENALKEVRSINGFVLGENGNEVECRNKVVEEICRFLRGTKIPKLLDFEPVGIEEQVRDVKVLLDMEGAQSALAVIVCGFGGMGKSTLAASVVQSLNWSSMDFKFCRVAFDNKTQEKTSHIKDLQKVILSYLGGVNVDLKDTFEGQFKIKEALENKRSFLLIDNVVDKFDIQHLLPKNLSYAGQNTKLRIIITAREKDVSVKLNIKWKEYEVKGLSDETSTSFLSKTIKQSQEVENLDPDEEERLINEVASACKGVPLLLSVFGQYLRWERDMDNYQEVLRVLRKGNLDSYRDEDLGTTLMHVYNKIKDDEVKEVFLDICAYFHGWEWNLVADIVDKCALNDLRRRMLVTKDGSGEVIVHDILLLMGMKEAKHTRFSNLEKLSDALEGSVNVKGISLVNDSNLTTIHSAQLEVTNQSLRVLMLGDWVTLNGPPVLKAFRNLRYLRLGDITIFPFNEPSKLVKLRVFLNRSKPGMNLSHLPSNLKRLSHEVPAVECDKFVKLPIQNLRSLERFIVQTQKSVGLPRILHLPASIELPEKLHLPASLVDLDLSTCKNIPKDMGHLTVLESVILDSSDLERLPLGFGKLKKLKHLSVDYCPKLAFLSEELGKLSSLKALSMNGCRNFIALPQSLGGLLSLQTFELSECTKLQKLPGSFGELRIQSLNLHSLVNLNELPNSFGNMPLLKDLSIISCHSLMSIPNTFVQLERLETLKIIECIKLSLLPEDFGRLRCLKNMTVEECQLLKELPHGFGALPALKTFRLRRCHSFVNLSRDFGELTSLEVLFLEALPLMSRIPDGFGKLKRLTFLDIWSCSQLKTLPDDFEIIATLVELRITSCSELDGAMMEKILKLPNCYMADISGSSKLLEKWEHVQGESENPIKVFNGYKKSVVREGMWRATRVALLHGKCMEVKNGTHQLMERSSLLVGLEEGTTATVALIMLPINMQSHQQEIVQRFLEKAEERAETNGWGKLQIVCARKVELDVERATPIEEEEESIRQILLSLPLGSCAIPSSEFKRVKVLTYCFGRDKTDKLSFLMADVGSDIHGRKIFKNCQLSEEISENVVFDSSEDEISGYVVSDSEEDEQENKNYNSIQNFIQSIYPVPYLQSQCVAGESRTKEFMEALKANGIDYLLADNSTSKVKVDDLHGKAIGFIICNFKLLRHIKLQQIYKDLQQKDSNFMWIWIPVFSKDCGYDSYARLFQCMPLVTFPHPQLVTLRRDHFEGIIDPCFVLLDKDGQIANRDALPLLMGWGLKSYPFTQHSIPESLPFVESESCLEFLLHGMNIVGRKQIKSKMTFLYAQRPSECLKMESEELTQIHGSFEVLYVGKFCEFELSLGNLKQDYEDATRNMPGPSLSFSDMIMFWHRCKYLASEEVYEFNKESNVMVEALHGLAKQLCRHRRRLVLVDNGGRMTRGWEDDGEDVLQMIRESSDEGEDVAQMLSQSLHDGERTPFMKTFVQTFSRNAWMYQRRTCDVCGRWDDGNVSRGYGVDLDLCRDCNSSISAAIEQY